MPSCRKCSTSLRPNIQLKNDLEFVEDSVNKQLKNFDDFLSENKRRKFVVLEIGAGPVQPLAREIAKMRYLNDKYNTTLIRINPVAERSAQYGWEREQYEKMNA